MKKALVFLAVIFMATSVWASDNCAVQAPEKVQCPKTTMDTDCLECHIKGNFKVKETKMDAHLVYPTYNMKVVLEGDNAKGYYVLEEINSTPVKDFFDYLDSHGITEAVIEVHSPGGSLFEAQRIVSLIQYWQSRGVHVETRLYGMAFSAGFYIFVAGDDRHISKYCDLMWHEIQSFEGFGMKIATPSDKEEAARILRHLQNVRHTYLATRGKLTKKEIDERVGKKEWWMSGPEAVKLGFADGLISEK